jgi:hypothetical protein
MKDVIPIAAILVMFLGPIITLWLVGAFEPLVDWRESNRKRITGKDGEKQAACRSKKPKLHIVRQRR